MIFDEKIHNAIPQIISPEINVALLSIASEDEVKEAVMSLNKDSSPGIDGFSGVFSQICLDTIKYDLIAAVNAFLEGGRYLALLPTLYFSSSPNWRTLYPSRIVTRLVFATSSTS